jgi:hypothetical protein
MSVKRTRAHLSAARLGLTEAIREFERTPARHKHPEVMLLNAKVESLRAQLDAVQLEALEVLKSVLKREGKSETIIARVL